MQGAVARRERVAIRRNPPADLRTRSVPGREPAPAGRSRPAMAMCRPPWRSPSPSSSTPSRPRRPPEKADPHRPRRERRRAAPPRRRHLRARPAPARPPRGSRGSPRSTPRSTGRAPSSSCWRTARSRPPRRRHALAPDAHVARGVGALPRLVHRLTTRCTGDTPFGGHGLVRPFYLLHPDGPRTSVLSAGGAAAVFMSLLLLAVRGRFPRHKKIARYTFPIWLYRLGDRGGSVVSRCCVAVFGV